MELTVFPENTSSKEWNEIVGAFGDQNFYQCWEWGEVKRKQGWKTLRMVCVESGVIKGAAQGFLKTVLRHNAGVLWVPGGPLVLKGSDDLTRTGNLEPVLKTIRRQFTEEENFVVRCAPYLISTPMSLRAIDTCGFRELKGPVFRYTILLDITDELESLRGKLRKDWRHALGRFDRTGTEIRHEMRDGAVLQFYEILKSREKVKGFYSGASLEQLLALAQFDDKARLLVAYNKSRPVGGVLISWFADRGLELFAGATEEGFKLKISHGLKWESIKWLKTVGVKTYDLGGVDPDGVKGVYAFKAGLRGELTEFLGRWETSSNRLMSAGLHLLEKLS